MVVFDKVPKKTHRLLVLACQLSFDIAFDHRNIHLTSFPSLFQNHSNLTQKINSQATKKTEKIPSDDKTNTHQALPIGIDAKKNINKNKGKRLMSILRFYQQLGCFKKKQTNQKLARCRKHFLEESQDFCFFWSNVFRSSKIICGPWPKLIDQELSAIILCKKFRLDSSKSLTNFFVSNLFLALQTLCLLLV
ncbi:MAG: hypothetical protein Q8P67_08560 [archaeon]|nr:hypothetical protein [archaeon]